MTEGVSARPGAPPIRIRLAEPRDAAPVSACWRNAISGAWSEPALRTLLGGRGSVWVAHDATARPLGFLAARRTVDRLEVLAVAVDVAARCRGVGALLLRRALDAARAQGCRGVDLEVAVDNHAALSLYRRFDFVAVGRRPRYYRNEVDALLLTREFADDR